jgi:hypothetical protein
MAICDAIFDGDRVPAGVSGGLFNDGCELIARLAAHDLVVLTTLDL